MPELSKKDGWLDGVDAIDEIVSPLTGNHVRWYDLTGQGYFCPNCFHPTTVGRRTIRSRGAKSVCFQCTFLRWKYLVTPKLLQYVQSLGCRRAAVKQ